MAATPQAKATFCCWTLLFSGGLLAAPQTPDNSNSDAPPADIAVSPLPAPGDTSGLDPWRPRSSDDPLLELDFLKSGVAQSRNLLGQTASSIGIGLDSIFGSPDKNQPNESSIILRTGVRLQDGEDSVLVNGLRFRADLPSTESKFQLLIRLDDENDIGGGSRKTQSSAVPDTDSGTAAANTDSGGRQPAAAPGSGTSQSSAPVSKGFLEADKAGLFLRYIFQRPESHWQTTFDAGWQLDTSELDTEAVTYLRTARNYQAGSWQLRPVPVIFWTEDNGPGSGITLHTQTELDSITTLQSSTGGHYMFDERATYYQHGWQLSKTFSPDLRVSYNLTFYTSDRTSDPLEEMEFSATLRRRLDGDWLFFSVTPADNRLLEEDFNSNFSLTFQFEAKFGTQY